MAPADVVIDDYNVLQPDIPSYDQELWLGGLDMKAAYPW
jgi:hypothetical protein